MRLRLAMSDAAWPPHPDLGTDAQLWIGGAAVGGTLDPALRGGADGPALRCALRDVEDGGSPSPKRRAEQARRAARGGVSPGAVTPPGVAPEQVRGDPALPSGEGEASALPYWDLLQINPGDRRAPERAGALLVVSMNVAPEAEAEFNAWYDTEHLPTLLAVPGVICGRRFRSEAGSPRYVAVYHLAGRETYAAEPSWLAVDQTPWIRRLRRFQRDRRYYMFRPDPHG